MADHPRAVHSLSSRIEKAIAILFGAVQPLPFGNAFSNANRAGDHILAYGSSWRGAPLPLTHSGRSLSLPVLEAAETAVRLVRDLPSTGYLTAEGTSLTLG
jgi:4-hydroxy-tetrahydrodipicolinate synthase